MSTLKKILISIGILLVLVGLVIGGLFIFTKKEAPEETTPDSNTVNAPLTVDKTKDLGACTLLDKGSLKKTLGTVATDLQGPDNVGLVKTGAGSTYLLQTCVYAFKTGGTIDNSFNISNGFSIEVAELADQTQANTLRKGYKDDGAMTVTALGDQAFYQVIVIDNPQAQLNTFSLTVFKGAKYYAYSITQPKDATTFTAQTAQQALETIAKSVSY
ncbi:MAG: hypothetical protein WAO28_04535 [Candidatus Microsaccharimonas sp.]